MKRKPFLFLFSIGALTFGALVVRGCSAGNDGYLADLGLSVPRSAVVSHQNYPGLVSDEDLLVLQLSPPRFAALLAQFKTKEEFALASPSAFAAATPNGLAPKKRFFAPVPTRALRGYFFVRYPGNTPIYPTGCDFAADKMTGRVWLHGTTIFN